ncbi:protein HAIKU1-like [Canna indica]|uniref:Protein HAIKU1-like n=1 Tax=Canna indica TaxID=4628 RepID=A0AAQ3JML7_9LILI|nr:protein HAIKU1-like [Canna indica]
MESSKNHHGLGANKAIKKDAGGGSALPRQPRIYNIRRSDFRSVVQQLTGASAALPRPRRLQQARPPPLSPVPRAADPPAATAAAVSPLSEYMRFLETSLLHSDGSHRPAAGSPLRYPPPATQLDLQSPSAFLNLMSPRCPPLSPGLRHSALPNVPFSPQPLALSPSMLFPTSPSAFLLASPTWKDL